MKFLLLLSALWWMRIRGLCKLPGGRDWLWGKLGLALVARLLLSRLEPILLYDIFKKVFPPTLGTRNTLS